MLMADKNSLWVEKYRPTMLSSYIFQDQQQKQIFQNFVKNKNIPHLLLSGVQGTGKTTLSKVLINELGIDENDVMVLNASDENNVETVREKIKSFVTTFPMGDFKVVVLDEADYISPAGQAILRGLMENYADVARFILTVNYENKVIPPIKSRCQQFHFKASDKDDIAEFVASILIQEGIKFDLDVLDKFIIAAYPDIRKTINSLQQHSTSGTLIISTNETESGDYKFQLLELLEKDAWKDIRQLLCANVTSEEWEQVYKFMYTNLNKAPKFKTLNNWEQGILIIADHLYKHSLCADPEINAAAMFIRLGQL